MQNFTMMKSLKTAALLGAMTLVGAVQAAGVPGQGTWETTLQARDLDGNLANGPEAFYDLDLNITWLSAGSADTMDWFRAKAWAETSNFFGLTGWRLPSTKVTTADGSCDLSWTGGTSCGYNPLSSVAEGSELAHLYYQSLGNKALFSPGTTTYQPGFGLTNTGGFQNFERYDYWSSEYAPDINVMWYFSSMGLQNFDAWYESKFARAVHAGDVGTVMPVPEPQTYALMLAGLGLMGFVARRRRSKQE